MNNITVVPLMCLLSCVLASTQMLLKRFLSLCATFQGSFAEKAILSLGSSLLWATIVGGVISIGLWIWILPRTSLTIAYPMISLSYVAMLFLAHFFENEPIYPLHIAGVALIMGGVALLACNR